MLRPSLHLTLVASVSVAGLTLPAPAYALTSGFVPTTARSLAPNAEADALLNSDGTALLVGMLLDQQVPMEWAFAGPATLRQRLGHLDAAAITFARRL